MMTDKIFTFIKQNQPLHPYQKNSNAHSPSLSFYICMYITYLSIYLSIYLFPTYLPIYISICLSVSYLPIYHYLSIYLFFCLSISLSIFIFIFQSISLSSLNWHISHIIKGIPNIVYIFQLIRIENFFSDLFLMNSTIINAEQDVLRDF